eukprot:TRINITY_DN946_c0_g1_i4.p1 TRINITY_DN946_c0_g1~~TRINITY_DN946_c0_g1_i4.p1  ORF type:complete len:207 (-),score=59.45 TRINITY_DN946_c0_g1_i4:335-955(-)
MTYNSLVVFFFFFFQAEDGIRDAQESRGLGDVYKRQVSTQSTGVVITFTMVSGIQVLGLAGVLTAGYAYHVESKLNDPFYQPICNTSWGSCATVFRSSYSHLISHFEILPKGHALDLSLAEAGMMVYAVYCLWPYLKKAVPYPHLILLAMSLAGCTMSVYLLYVLKFILKDFCIVCTTFHVINFSMMGFVLKEFAAHKTSCKPKTN